MTVNRATLDLIREFEGLRTEAYADPAHGWAVPTIGIGHTSAAGPPAVRQGMTITEGEAYDILARDLEAVERSVRSLVKVPLTENQFGALVSFTFNLGVGNFRSSTLLKLLNAGDYAGAAAQFPRWNRAAGKVMKGLTRRREAERALFLSPAALASPPPPPPDWDSTLSGPASRPTGPLAGLLAILAAGGIALWSLVQDHLIAAIGFGVLALIVGGAIVFLLKRKD